MSDMITIGHTVTHYRALRWGKKKKKKKKERERERSSISLLLFFEKCVDNAQR